jgi:hypothetical protein
MLFDPSCKAYIPNAIEYGPLMGNIYYSISTCEHPAIKKLYEYWVRRNE